jgi:acetaldehyde dehydrogenase (acetylating)
MTLGCGGWGGNITSDNISPRHLLNIKRLAYEVRPAVKTATSPSNVARSAPQAIPAADTSRPRLPKAPARPEPSGIPVQALEARIDSFLESRGYRAPADTGGVRPQPSAQSPAAFVCEDDVRAALKAGRKVVIDERTIVTPSARDLGEAQKVFVEAGLPR